MILPLVFYPPPPNLRQWIALFAVTEGWPLLDIGRFVLVFQLTVLSRCIIEDLVAFLCCNVAFYTPVFRRDVLWYGDVRPSVRPSVRPFSALFSYMLWHIELKFCTWLCFNVLQIKFECRHFASIFIRPSGRIMVWWCPSVRPSGSPSARFPNFSPTCFDILSWNFAHDFVQMYYRSSLSVVNLRQFLWELCPFWNLNYWKYTVFRTFLLHALTYWAEILHRTLFYCTTDQVRVSSISVNFYGSYAPFGT